MITRRSTLGITTLWPSDPARARRIMEAAGLRFRATATPARDWARGMTAMERGAALPTGAWTGEAAPVPPEVGHTWDASVVQAATERKAQAISEHMAVDDGAEDRDELMPAPAEEAPGNPHIAAGSTDVCGDGGCVAQHAGAARDSTMDQDDDATPVDPAHPPGGAPVAGDGGAPTRQARQARQGPRLAEVLAGPTHQDRLTWRIADALVKRSARAERRVAALRRRLASASARGLRVRPPPEPGEPEVLRRMKRPRLASRVRS